MIEVLLLLVSFLKSGFKNRAGLAFENLALRQRTPANVNSFRYFFQERVAPRIQATALGARSNCKESSGEFKKSPLAAPSIRQVISWRTSSAPAPAKPFRSTTTFSTNCCAELVFGMSVMGA